MKAAGHLSPIVIIPAADEHVASSRIRAHTFMRELLALGRPHTLHLTDDCSAVLIQKRLTKDILDFARRQRRRGLAIVYDVDDFGHALDHWAPISLQRQMFQIADLIITATKEQSQIVCSHHPVHDITAISNCIDYYPAKPLPCNSFPSEKTRVLWFGNAQNLWLLEKYVPAILSSGSVELVICTNPSGSTDFLMRWPQTLLVPWELASFVDTLRSCHVTCLMHDGNHIDRAKANNRMITSITWGVPAIVSNTPAYVETAAEIGVPRAVFNDPAELSSKIAELTDSGARRSYLEAAQDRTWQIYSPRTIALEYLTAIDGVTRRVQNGGLIRRLQRKHLS
jgi:glycosyltransferase involved in cell wall biosynthesis